MDILAAMATAAESTPEGAPANDAAGRMYLLVFERGSSWVFELPRDGDVLIGRGDLAELRLRDSAVSRKHASIRIVDGAASLKDLGSHNGTYVNDARLDGERALRSGDAIAICGAKLVVYTSAPRVGSRWLVELPRFRERFDQELERSLRYQRPFTVMIGLLHDAGERDGVERALVSLRGLDVGAWLDPMQLAILAPETGPDDADAMAHRIRDLLSGVAIELGYAVCPIDGCDADALILGARAAASAVARGGVAAAATSLRTYRIGARNVIVAEPAMSRLYALIDRLARVDLPVLIWGETGTGKELAATMLHERSQRRDRPLVALNCAAIQENLVESELFGYERGAFSGAVGTKQGLLEAADGGTVFLDEVGELPLAIQAKLLRVLESKRITRIGDVKEREIDIRLVAATNRNPQEEVDAGRFRRDLFFRLSGATLVIPPLRDRPRELPLLAESFLSEACRAAGRPSLAIAQEAIEALGDYAWPGNVRELKNVMEYLAATVGGPMVGAAPLRERLGVNAAPVAAARDDAPQTFQPIADEIRALEVARMSQALDAAGGNQKRAAELIGMPLRTFFTKMRQYNLRKPG